MVAYQSAINSYFPIKFDMNKDVLFEDLKNYFGKVENE